MAEKIRILFIIDKLAPGKGGVSTHLIELLKNLDRNRFVPFVCALGGEKAGGQIDEIRLLKVDINFFDVNKIYGMKAFSSFLKVSHFIKDGRFDIVCTYLFSSNIYGVLAAKFAGIKTIVANKREIVTWKKWHHIVVSRIANSFCQQIIVNSNASKEAVVNIEKALPEKVVVIHNGTDLKRFDSSLDGTAKRSALGLKGDNIVIGMVSNFIPIKDHSTLFKAAKTVIEKHPEVRLLLLGGGPLESDARKQVQELGIQNNVIFAGRQPQIQEYFAVMDICVCTSLFEGFSNALLEAQAMAKPVIATAVGGNLDLVIDGQNGFLFPKEDPAALASKINQLIDNKPLAEEMGARGRKIVEEKFTSQEMARKTEQLYLELLENRKLGKGR